MSPQRSHAKATLVGQPDVRLAGYLAEVDMLLEALGAMRIFCILLEVDNVIVFVGSSDGEVKPVAELSILWPPWVEEFNQVICY
jgi:hypothetical protein